MKKLSRFRPLAGLVVFSSTLLWSQNPSPNNAPAAPSRGEAYFNYSMAHIYSELAASYGNRAEYLNQAIDYYKAAIKADPDAGFLSTELSDLYVQAGQINKAVSESEAALKANPNDLSARRILGRIYARLIGDPSQNRVREDMVRKALDQYEKIVDSAPKDAESWIMIGRLQKVVNNNADSEKAFQKALDISPENQDALAGLAMAAAEKGDLNAAASLLEKANANNANPRGLAQLAETYEQQRDFKNASKAWQRALDLSGGNPEIKRALANSLVQSDQLDEAVAVFTELAEEEPRDLISVLRLSQIYRQKRDFANARKFGEKAKEIDGTNLEVLYNDVFILEAEGKPDEAIAALRQVVASTERKTYLPQEKQNRILLLDRLARMLRANEKYDEAIQTFESIVSLEPQAAKDMRPQLVETYRQARRFDKALSLADEAIAADPSNRTLTLLKGQILADSGKPKAGAALLEQALEKEPDLEIYLSLAQVQERAKNFPQMQSALDKAEAMAKSSDDKIRVQFLRGAMFEKQKNFDAAEAEFRKILALEPENASALNYLGYMLVDRSIRLEEAYQMIRKAVDQEPNNSAYLDSLGWAYFRMDKLDEAEKYLKMSLERLSKDPTVHDHLGDVYLRQGKVKEAIAQWERSLVEWNASAEADRDSTAIAGVQKKLDSAKIRLAQEATPKRKP
ncbi:MAG: hypothetical protein OHK0021_06150 [Bryobacter sp.]